MLLKRKRAEYEGLYQASGFKYKQSGSVGLKKGSYFVSLAACKMIETEFNGQPNEDHEDVHSTYSKAPLEAIFIPQVASALPVQLIAIPEEKSNPQFSTRYQPVLPAHNVLPPNSITVTYPYIPAASPLVIATVPNTEEPSTILYDPANSSNILYLPNTLRIGNSATYPPPPPNTVYIPSVASASTLPTIVIPTRLDENSMPAVVNNDSVHPHAFLEEPVYPCTCPCCTNRSRMEFM